MPGITTRHTQPNNFEKMRATYAFQLFSDTVLNGLRLYKNDVEAKCGSIQPVLTFFGMMRDLIEIMSSRFPAKALRPDSAAVDKLLSFQPTLLNGSLAKSVSHGNTEPGILTALLGADAAGGDHRTKQFLLDQLIADGDLCSAELALNSIEKAAPDHVACVSAKSDERLIFYVAGYVARKFLAKTSCDACKNVLLADKNDIKNLQAAQLTQLKDNGGLLYPSGFLFRFLKNLENLFTGCFSAKSFITKASWM
ncbi:hypothetical protein HPB51_020107 [Rhipicephalus microplus]|uniref:Transposable element n=1 Tax=Rhipicephalus microplus TaxID=6941 RepID=A0A9J6EIC3_RHIMP|nr:hypothetical protein HPB51_020107 [Rhipicephalus microplus]